MLLKHLKRQLEEQALSAKPFADRKRELIDLFSDGTVPFEWVDSPGGVAISGKIPIAPEGMQVSREDEAAKKP